MLIPPRPIVLGCRYFKADDGGMDYTIVARDLDHANEILRASGLEFCNDDGDSVPFDQAKFTWREYSAKRAAKIRCFVDDGGAGPYPLNTFGPGEWFCSEY
jgi:hypothetical protein